MIRRAVLGGELAVPCTCNPLQQGRIPPRGRRSREPTTFATLKTGSRAAATREPCQVRKEAALSGDRRVPRNGLVRVAGVGGRGSVLIDGGCTANSSLDTARRRSAVDRRDPAPGALPPLAGPDVLRDRRPGGGRRHAAQRRGDRACLARDPVHGAARNRQDVARPDPRQGASTARTSSRTPTPATAARRASRSARAARWTSSRSTPRPTAASRPSASCASASPTRPRTCGARSTSSTRRTRSRRTPGTRCSSRSRSRPSSSPSCSRRRTRRSSRRRSCRGCSGSTSGA